MADLIFGCTGAAAERYAATPTLTFQLTITERSGVRIHAIALRCQIRIEPHRRRYTAAEAQEYGFVDGIVGSFGQIMPARRHRIGLKGPEMSPEMSRA